MYTKQGINIKPFQNQSTWQGRPTNWSILSHISQHLPTRSMYTRSAHQRSRTTSLALHCLLSNNLWRFYACVNYELPEFCIGIFNIWNNNKLLFMKYSPIFGWSNIFIILTSRNNWNKQRKLWYNKDWFFIYENMYLDIYIAT